MSIIIIIGIALIIWLGCFITGVACFLAEKKKLGTVFIAIPILMIIGFVSFYKWYNNTTTPESLAISIESKADHYVLNGEWQERIDHNALGVDYLVFYTKDNQTVSILSANRGNPSFHLEALTDYAREILLHQDVPAITSGLEPQLYDLDLKESFTIEFRLPDNLNLEDVTIQYLHLIDEAMGPLKFWLKTVQP